jgi:hypothetical protein
VLPAKVAFCGVVWETSNTDGGTDMWCTLIAFVTQSRAAQLLSFVTQSPLLLTSPKPIWSTCGLLYTHVHTTGTLPLAYSYANYTCIYRYDPEEGGDIRVLANKLELGWLWVNAYGAHSWLHLCTDGLNTFIYLKQEGFNPLLCFIEK